MQPTIKKTLNAKPPNTKNLNLAVYYKVTARENSIIPNRTLLGLLQDIDNVKAIDLSRDVVGPLNIELFLLTLEYARRTYPSIRRIDLSGNAVTNDTVRQLVRVITLFPGVQELDLSQGNFGAPGALLLMRLRKSGVKIACRQCKAVRGRELLEMQEAGIQVT